MWVQVRKYALRLGMVALVCAPALPLGAQTARPVPPPANSKAVSTPALNPGTNVTQSPLATAELGYRLFEDRQKKQSAEQDRKLVETGEVSALDLEASLEAVREYNKGWKALNNEAYKDAVAHLQKSIKEYPKFVSAHMVLGLAYQDLNDAAQAQAEYELAAKLDPKFALPLLALGRMQLAEEHLEAANTVLAQAFALQPRDARVLTLLCYTQYGTHQYRQALETAALLHQLAHRGMGMAHYVAAAAAIALDERPTIKRELELFVQEDPQNPLVPQARQNIEMLSAELETKPAAMPGAPPPAAPKPPL